jgi:hypothetical protein
LTGAAITILVVVSLTIFVGAVVNPFLYDLFAERNSEEGVAFTGRGWSAYTNLSLLFHFLAVILGFFVGGAVTGRVVPSSPGFNSVGAALLAIGAGIVWMLVTFLPVLLTTLSGPSDPYTRGENLGLLAVWIFAFCVVAPLSALASYLGGRLGRCLSGAA